MSSINSYETQNGKRYRVRYRYPNGTQTDKRGFKTKSEAQTWLYKLENDRQKGNIVKESAGKQTVQELAEEWLETKINLKLSSLERNKVTIKNQIIPQLGDYQIKNLNHATIQKTLNQLSKIYKPSTVRKTHRCLSQMLDYAYKNNRLSTNPAKGLTLPQLKRNEPVFLTVSELYNLAQKTEGYNDVIIFLGISGLRFGEMTALKVKRWNGETRKLVVAENATEVNGELVWGTPKTGKSRTIIVPETVAKILNNNTLNKKPNDLIFYTKENSPIRINNFRNRVFNKALKESGLPKITLHDLRHTAASIAISSGANVKVVQQMLGHASAAMTLDIYGGLFEEDMSKTAQMIEAIIEENKPKLRII